MKQTHDIGVEIKPRALNTLTSFRFIAALMVFIWHTHIYANVLDPLQLGYIGVGFFYMLSGFILTYVYWDKLRQHKPHAVKNFYIARFAKIYPVHLLTFILSIPLALLLAKAFFPVHTKQMLVEAGFANIGLIQSYFSLPQTHFSFNGVAWSISNEVFFYALFPMIILLLARYHKYLTLRSTLIAMFVLWAGLMVSLGPQASFIDDWRFYILPPVRLPDFFMGILLALVYMRSSSVQFRFSAKRFTQLEVGSIMILVLAILASEFLPQSLHFGVWMMPFWAVLIFVFAQERGLISQKLQSRGLVILGEISFSFYMIHQLVIRYLGLGGIEGRKGALLSLVLSVVLSAATYYYFEEPMRIKVKKYLELKTFGLRRIAKRLLPQKQGLPQSGIAAIELE